LQEIVSEKVEGRRAASGRLVEVAGSAVSERTAAGALTSWRHPTSLKDPKEGPEKPLPPSRIHSYSLFMPGSVERRHDNERARRVGREVPAFES